MTREEALQFKQRWQIANDFVAEEIRNTPPRVRLRQLRTMIATAHRRRHPDPSRDAATFVSAGASLKNDYMPDVNQPKDILPVLTSLTEWFNEQNLSYAIIGGVAIGLIASHLRQRILTL